MLCGHPACSNVQESCNKVRFGLHKSRNVRVSEVMGVVAIRQAIKRSLGLNLPLGGDMVVP
jgi:hypothetical protein